MTARTDDYNEIVLRVGPVVTPAIKSLWATPLLRRSPSQNHRQAVLRSSSEAGAELVLSDKTFSRPCR